MTSPSEDPLLSLIHVWASHFGYYDGKIDLQQGGDLGEFTTPNCTLTAHAPLWGTKEGQEVATPVADVRKQLARMLWWTRIGRHDMHLARHPTEEALCLFFVVKAQFFLLPVNLMTVPLAFVVSTSDTEQGLRIKEIHEWPADTPEQARQVLMENCGWPAETEFTAHVAFGAVS